MDDKDSVTVSEQLGFRNDMADQDSGLLNHMVDLFIQPALQSPWMGIEEAEHYAHVRHGVISKAIRNGELVAYQRAGIRGKIVHKDDVDRWIRECWTCTRIRMPEMVEV